MPCQGFGKVLELRGNDEREAVAEPVVFDDRGDAPSGDDPSVDIVVPSRGGCQLGRSRGMEAEVAAKVCLVVLPESKVPRVIRKNPAVARKLQESKVSGSWAEFMRRNAPSACSGLSSSRCAAILRASGELRMLIMAPLWLP
eukprot:16451648-Heterocapsa_arctica.AAC.1